MNSPHKTHSAPLIFLQTLLFLGCVLLFSSGCYRDDIRTIEISVGHLGGQKCFDAISKAIKDELVPRNSTTDNRLKKVTADYNAHKIVVQFKARDLAIKNIERAIAKAGFTTYNPDGSISIPAVGSPPPGCEKP